MHQLQENVVGYRKFELNKEVGEKLALVDIPSAFRKGIFFLKAQSIVPFVENPVLVDDDYRDFEVTLGVHNNHWFKFKLDEIISLFEKQEQAWSLDEFVIQEVAGLLSGDGNQFDQDLRFHINLSGSSLSNVSFMDALLCKIERGEVQGNNISFEITETYHIEDLDPVYEFIVAAQRYGCKFSLDDFGKGYSSYRYLNRLPVDVIKIDGTYIANINSSLSAFNIVKSMVCLAKDMGIATVAECVETRQQYETVVELGVNSGQGFYFSVPQSIQTLAQYGNG